MTITYSVFVRFLTFAWCQIEKKWTLKDDDWFHFSSFQGVFRCFYLFSFHLVKKNIAKMIVQIPDHVKYQFSHNLRRHQNKTFFITNLSLAYCNYSFLSLGCMHPGPYSQEETTTEAKDPEGIARAPKARERPAKAGVSLGGSGGMSPREMLKYVISSVFRAFW